MTDKINKEPTGCAPPEFVPVVCSEELIEIPANAVGRVHTQRLYGGGSGRIGWSPITKVSLAKSGWVPPGRKKTPDLYTVSFVHRCANCPPRTPISNCRHPVKDLRLTGDVIVDLNKTLLACQDKPVSPMSYEEFVKLDRKHKMDRYAPRRHWKKDGRGPVFLGTAVREKLGDAVAKIAATSGRKLLKIEELKPLFSAVIDARDLSTELLDKLSLRGDGE